jgi:hypothetical protein
MATGPRTWVEGNLPAESPAMNQETIPSTKRLLKITAGNLKNNHIYVRKPFDFFRR